MTGLDIFATIVLILVIATVVGVLVVLAMMPGKIAAQRNHPQAEAVKVAGWLGMLTGIIWILAMIWAYIKPTDSDTHINSESIEELPE
jgi:NADH:ubiquinone oxidoreductase subunit 6 (subunit J)